MIPGHELCVDDRRDRLGQIREEKNQRYVPTTSRVLRASVRTMTGGRRASTVPAMTTKACMVKKWPTVSIAPNPLPHQVGAAASPSEGRLVDMQL